MTQENKELLLKDLLARLLYGVKCKYYDCCEGDYIEGTICGFERQEYMQIDGVCIYIGNVKLYLRPLSSMTEEEKKEYQAFFNYDGVEYPEEYIDWLNVHYFDYRSLIEKGLALEAPEGMYKTE